MGYDAKKFRVDLAQRGTATVILTNPTHKHQWYINRETYKDRNLVSALTGTDPGLLMEADPADAH
jgi:hypothetical protein